MLADTGPLDAVGSLIAIVGGLIAIVGGIIGFKTYRQATAPKAVCEWHSGVPVAVGSNENNPRIHVMEAALTNIGARKLCLIEIGGGKWDRDKRYKPPFARLKNSFSKTRIPAVDLAQQPEVFLLRPEIQGYDPTTMLDGAIKFPDNFLRHTIPIEPGETYRLVLCFIFPAYQPCTDPDVDAIITVKCTFNTGQTTSYTEGFDGRGHRLATRYHSDEALKRL